MPPRFFEQLEAQYDFYAREDFRKRNPDFFKSTSTPVGPDSPVLNIAGSMGQRSIIASLVKGKEHSRKRCGGSNRQ